jgi:membrane protease YdiL (CAAX protease family)
MRRVLAVRNTAIVLLAIWSLPYLVYAAGTGDLHVAALLRLLLAASPLLFLYRSVSPQDVARFTWQDLIGAAWFAVVLLFHELRGVWNVPINLDFMTRLYLIVVACHCWIFVRPVPGLGYRCELSLLTLRAAVINFLAFAAIALPVGFAMRFTSWNPRWHGLTRFCEEYIEIFFFIALLEELFFRGYLQNLLSNTLRSARNAQALVSCIFGLFHILHAPFPNWRYVALATVAGWFYGSAFVTSGNLLAPALTHALVDTVWRTYFTHT